MLMYPGTLSWTKSLLLCEKERVLTTAMKTHAVLWGHLQRKISQECFVLLIIGRAIKAEIPYSVKFLRNKIFADRPLTNFRGNKFRGSRILVSHAHFCGCMHYLCSQSQQRHTWLLASKFKRFCSGANFVQGLLSFVRWSLSTTHLKPEMPSH